MKPHIKATIPEASEHQEQVSLMQWSELYSNQYPDLRLLYAIANGGKRNINVARKLKAEGVKSGVPDLHLPVAVGRYHGLYIELKIGNNKPTENQERWLSDLNKQGHFAICCWGWENARDVLLKYLKGEL